MSSSIILFSFLEALGALTWTSFFIYLLLPLGSLVFLLFFKNRLQQFFGVLGILISIGLLIGINAQELNFLLKAIFESSNKNSKIYFFETEFSMDSLTASTANIEFERLPLEGATSGQLYLCAREKLIESNFMGRTSLLSFSAESADKGSDLNSLFFLERLFQNRLNESKTALELAKKRAPRAFDSLKLFDQQTMMNILKNFHRGMILVQWSEKDRSFDVYSNLNSIQFSEVTESCQKAIQTRSSEVQILSATNIFPLLSFREGLHFGSTNIEFKANAWEEYAKKIFWVMGVRGEQRVAVIPSWEGPRLFVCNELEDPLCFVNLLSSRRTEEFVEIDFANEILKTFLAEDKEELFKGSCADLNSIKTSEIDSAQLLSYSLSCMFRDLDFAYGGVGLARLMQRGSPKFFEYLAEQSFLGLCFGSPQVVPTLSEVRDKLISDFVFPYRTRHSRSCLQRLESKENRLLYEDVFRQGLQETPFYFRQYAREIDLRNQWRALVIHSIRNRHFERLPDQKLVHDQLFEKVHLRTSFGRFDKFVHHLYVKAREGQISQADLDDIDKFFQRERELGSDFMLLPYYKLLVSMNKYFIQNEFHEKLFERTLDQPYCRFHCLQTLDDYTRNTLGRPVESWENYKERDLEVKDRLNKRKTYLRSLISKS